MSEWIDINERLPDASDTGDIQRPVIGYCMRDKCQYTVIFWNNKFHHLDCGRIVHGGVTHWMPLPEPPKQEQ